MSILKWTKYAPYEIYWVAEYKGMRLQIDTWFLKDGQVFAYMIEKPVMGGMERVYESERMYISLEECIDMAEAALPIYEVYALPD